jgi:hypothetical protein
MVTVRVERTVDVARDSLFAVFADHEGYGRFRGVKKCELIRPGRDERNGLGALRRVHLGGPTVLDEEIVAYDAPHSYEYRIVRARPLPVKHTLGRVELEALDANRTKVVWTSTFDIPIPIIGKAISERVAVQFTRAFDATILAAAALATEQAA